MEFSKLIRNFITNKTTLARTVRYFGFIALTVLLTWENDFVDELRDIGASNPPSYIFNDSFFNTLSILLYTGMYLITGIWSIFYIIYLFSTYRKSHNQDVSPKEIILFFIIIISSIIIILMGALFGVYGSFGLPHSLHTIIIITIFSFAISIAILFWKDQKIIKKWYIAQGVSITVFFLIIIGGKPSFWSELIGLWMLLATLLLAVEGMNILKLITGLILIFIGILWVGWGGFFIIRGFSDNYIPLILVPYLFIGLGILFLGYKTLRDIKRNSNNL